MIFFKLKVITEKCFSRSKKLGMAAMVSRCGSGSERVLLWKARLKRWISHKEVLTGDVFRSHHFEWFQSENFQMDISGSENQTCESQLATPQSDFAFCPVWLPVRSVHRMAFPKNAGHKTGQSLNLKNCRFTSSYGDFFLFYYIIIA